MFVLTLVVLYYFHGPDVIESIPNTILVILSLLDGLMLGNICTYIRRFIQHNRTRGLEFRAGLAAYVGLLRAELAHTEPGCQRHAELVQFIEEYERKLVKLR